MSKSSGEQIEQDEKKLLYELVKNSKENIETIAKHCGFSRQKTWRMIKQLEAKKMIWGYTAIFNEEKIGYRHFILLIKKSNEKVDEKAVNVITSKEADDVAGAFGITIESSVYIHGEYDWLVTFNATNIIEAKQFSDRLIALYPQLIQKTTIIQTLMFVRKNYILNPERKKLKEFM